MADMTFAAKIARTLEIDAELRAVWGDGLTTVGIHRLNHMDVHEGTLLTATACLNGFTGEWIVSAHLGERYKTPIAYATGDPECSTCRALIAESKARGEVQP